MAYCGTATKWAKVGLVAQYIGLALFLSGFSTIGWMATLTIQNNKDIIVGLFRMIDCSTGSCTTQERSSAYENSGRDGTLGLMIVVLIVSVITTVLYSIYVAAEGARYRTMIITIMCFTFFAALFILIGVIVYATAVPTDFYASYSLGLVTIASFLFICAGCMLIPDIKNKVYRRRSHTRVVRTPSTPSLPEIESPPPRYTSRAESPVYYTPRRPKGVWIYKEYDDHSAYTRKQRSTPREIKRSYSPPREVVRVHHVRGPPVSQISYASPRRYGTPPSVQRYDYKAR
ncbi:uncharacterized protein LOC133184632 [Saccostrea echinata]|uniref:uncharacterized protein LOC133184632 n=1 Tax=Saccostrea echinata TaxID=191078 RepID=UPI002A808B20|nr:uncharacterized protein LOC133184632 [Saccostrea echinata]